MPTLAPSAPRPGSHLPIRLPAPTCRAPSAPALMAKVGRESRLWSPSAGNFSLWGEKAVRGTLPSSGGPFMPHHRPQTPPSPGLCHRGRPDTARHSVALVWPPPSSFPASPTSCAASCRVSARRERVRRTVLSSSARGSGEALGGPGGGPGAAALSGHRLSAARTRQQTPAGEGRRRTQAGLAVRGRRTGGSRAPGRSTQGRLPAGAGFPLPLRLWLPRPSEQTRPRAGRRAGRLPSAPGRRNLGPGAGHEGEAQARTCPLPGPREPGPD